MTGAMAVQSSSPIGFETLYAGYRWDSAAPQMYYVRNRFLLPVIGTWNRRDPLGYVDGMSLSEYASSSPAVSMDPMGLYESDDMPWWAKQHGGPGRNCAACHPPQDPVLPEAPATDGTCRIKLHKSCDAVAGPLIAQHVADSCQCLRKASDLIEKHYAAVQEFYKGKKVFSFPLLMDETGRNTLLAMITEARTRCDGRRINALKFCCADSCPPGRDAFVNFMIGTNLVTGSCIMLCPSFFTVHSDRQRNIILHEIGRFVNGLGEENTGTWKDVYVWDGLLQSLCRNFTAIMKKSRDAIM